MRRLTAISTHKFSSWLYHVVLFSKLLLALQLLSRRGTQPETCYRPCPIKAPCCSLALPWLTTLFWSPVETPRISRGHLPISFHNTYTCPVNHVTASAYFHKCVLLRISDWWLNQGSKCNDIKENEKAKTKQHWNLVLGWVKCSAILWQRKALDYEKPSSPDTLQIVLTGFINMA